MLMWCSMLAWCFVLGQVHAVKEKSATPTAHGLQDAAFIEDKLCGIFAASRICDKHALVTRVAMRIQNVNAIFGDKHPESISGAAIPRQSEARGFAWRCNPHRKAWHSF